MWLNSKITDIVVMPSAREMDSIDRPLSNIAVAQRATTATSEKERKRVALLINNVFHCVVLSRPDYK